MAKPKPVTVGDLTFASKKAAIDFFSAMLNSYPLLARVSDRDASILHPLLAGHPDSENKVRGCEISHFEVHPFVEGSKCFFLCRSDGTKEHFSFPRCVDNMAEKQCVQRAERMNLQPN